MPVDLSNYINYVHKRASPYKKISSGVEFVFKVSVLQLNASVGQESTNVSIVKETHR